MKIREIALVGGLYLSGVAAEGQNLVILQIVSVSLILVSAGIFLCIGIPRIKPTHFEVLIFGAIFLSAVVGICRDAPLAVVYSFLFASAFAALCVIGRELPLLRVINLISNVCVALVLTNVLVSGSELINLAGGTVERSIGLVRYEALGLHPNLTGLVYGAAVLLSFAFALDRSYGWVRLLWVVVGATAMAIVFAASARASLVALAITAIIAALVNLKKSLVFTVVLSVAVIATVASAVATSWIDVPAEYFRVILDIESDTRGLQSGASGRAELWGKGLDLLLSDPVIFFFGLGLRAAGPEMIGFYVESSYINIALEFGAVLGGAILVAFASIAVKLVREDERAKAIAGWLIFFVMIQSIFNRYLLGIGNPVSLSVLLISVAACIGVGHRR